MQVVSTRDITEHNQAQEALQIKENRRCKQDKMKEMRKIQQQHPP